MKRPLIGIIPLIDIERESYWMLPGYMKGIEEAGGIPVMLPLTSDREALGKLVNYFDGFLFTGGHDISPSLYREEVSAQCGECCPQRDEMETILLSMVLEQDKPVLGICRGLQLINVTLGGSLYQDLPIQHPSSVCHRQPAPYDQPIHPVELVPNTPLQKCLGKEELPVNSCHHQGIKELASGLQPMAYAQDGLVEAVWKPGSRFVWAVQWHPEFSHKVDENSRKIFRTFVKAAAGDSIFGADGPTSVYIKGVTDREVSPRELEERALFKKKKEEIEKSITPDPHTIDQVIQFIIEKYHGKELPGNTHTYRIQKESIREALITQYCPQLLKEANIPSLENIRFSENMDPEEQKAVLEQMNIQQEIRHKKINEIPDEKFPMDYHMFEILCGEGRVHVDIEKHWGLLGCGFSGNEPKLREICKDIMLYYGVTEEDIKTKSERFSSLVLELCL